MSGANVLITGARAPAALDLARSFRAAGWLPHLADCSPCLTARMSNAPAAVHAYASPVRNPKRFASDVDRLIVQLDPALVVPVCEEAFHLAELAMRRPSLAARLFAPPFATLKALHSKWLFVEGCRERGLPVPETWRLGYGRDLDGLPPPTDLVLKPEYSRFGVHALMRPTPEAASKLRLDPARPWVAQRYIPGAEVSFYAVARDAKLAAFSAYASTWRERGGASYAFEAPEAAVTTLLRGLAVELARWVTHGQFACDVILDGGGRPWLLECNPRATSGVHLFGRGPALARALMGEANSVEPADSRFLSLAPAFWFFGWPAALRAGRIAEWRERRRSGQDVIGGAGDRAPLLGALADSAAFALAALVSGRSLAAAMTADIEWNGEAA